MEPIAKKTYYSVSEVSELTGLKAHVLRYWETQFDVISPSKNRGGTRVYQAEEIERILLVKQLLYERRFTIEGARQKLKEMRQEGTVAEAQKHNVGPAVLATIKDGLQAVQDVLTLPESPRPAEGRSAGERARSASGSGDALAKDGLMPGGSDESLARRDSSSVGGDPPLAGGDPSSVGGDPPLAGGDPPSVGGERSLAGGEPPSVGDEPSPDSGEPPSVENPFDPR